MEDKQRTHMNCCMYDRGARACRALSETVCVRKGPGKCRFHKTKLEAREGAYKSLARRQLMGAATTPFDKPLMASTARRK